MPRVACLLGLACIVVTGAAPASAAAATHRFAADAPAERSIDFVGAFRDREDLARLRLGRAGYWFPQFDASSPVNGRPTEENARAALPAWVAPLNHWGEPSDLGCTPAELAEGCLPGFPFRTFSQDGPARSAGGQPGWSVLRLPNGEIGASGAIVDPFTARGNRNNAINRIQLRGEVPAVFHLSVLTDNTAREHDPGRTLVVRGNAGTLDTDATQIESSSDPGSCELAFNGVADVHSFRIEGFRAGDYLKLRLAAAASSAAGASFGGLVFDERLSPRGPRRRSMC